MSKPSASPFSAPEWLDYLSRMLPAYEFVAFIAQGGMGAVFKARQRSLDRDVAIKILALDLRGDEMFRQSFETEARAMARLNHPNLISVYASGEVDGMPYIVMEFVPGKSLYHSAYGKRVDPGEAVRITRSICLGLAHAHENGVIHRDIKPANILLTPKAEPKIGDFGLAMPHDGNSSGPAMGTPGYTAPELYSHPELADRRSDLYAVGAILFELVSGKRPGETQIRADDLKGCPASLQPICRRALQPNPQLRYPDAVAMAAALEEWQRQHNENPSPARSMPGKPGAAAPPAAIPPSPPAGAGPVKRPERSLSPVTASSAPQNTGLHDNWYLLIRILLIVGMLGSIPFTYKALIRYREQRAQKQEDERAIQEQAKTQNHNHSKHQPQSPPTPPPPDSDTKPPTLKTTAQEPSMDALARLRESLKSGKRQEFPVGTIQHGDSHYFAVSQPMTWLEASAFAESHGGHLPIPTDSGDLAWLAGQSGDAEWAWLGLGKTPDSQWLLANGTPWSIGTNPSGHGLFAAISRTGSLHAEEAAQCLPFVIQWHDNGTNPAAFIRVCQNLRSATTPTWPPGTAIYQSSHYFIVLHKTRWDIAKNIAHKLGGHLATISSPGEATWLKSLVANHSIEEPLWTAGRFGNDNRWSWTTKEEWIPSGWFVDGNAPEPGGYLLLDPVRGWVNGPQDSPPHGFVIEWDAGPTGGNANPPLAGGISSRESTDKPAEVGTRSETAKPSAPMPEEAITIQPRAKQLMASAAKERDDQLVANAKQFSWDIDFWVRGLSKAELPLWQPEATAFKLLVRDKYVPEELPASSGIRISPQMARVAVFCAGKQRSIEAAYLAKARKIQEAYLAKLNSLANAESSLGHEENAQRLHDMGSSATNIDAWLDTLGYPVRTAKYNESRGSPRH